MHDERGFRPFEIVPGSEGLPDYDRIVPAFFRSLDRKMQHLSDQGFVAMLETIRRDVAPPWKAYFDFNESFATVPAVHGGALRRVQHDLQQGPLRHLPPEATA